MKKLSRAAFAALGAVAASAAFASSAAADTIRVDEGHSIQAAINRAEPGDTVLVDDGVYRENVWITTNGIRLIGDHATLRKPSQKPAADPCRDPNNPNSALPGICILGKSASNPVRDVTVAGFTVDKFGSDGVFIFQAKRATLSHNRLWENHGYGAFANTSSGTRFLSNSARWNGDAGLYVGDSPHANALVLNNVSANNDDLGILLRNAETGKIKGNSLFENCGGLIALADAPGPSGNWAIENDHVFENDRACAGDEGPAFSGIGIGILGAHDTEVEENLVTDNRPGGKTFTSGGIIVSRGIGNPGTAPRNVSVHDNRADDNSPFDIRWDRSGTNVRFDDNRCDRSSPSVICD